MHIADFVLSVSSIRVLAVETRYLQVFPRLPVPTFQDIILLPLL